jgi:hypothetical protein
VDLQDAYKRVAPFVTQSLDFFFFRLPFEYFWYDIHQTTFTRERSSESAEAQT